MLVRVLLVAAIAFAWSPEVDFGVPESEVERRSAIHFGYEGEDGPQNWAALDATYSTCDSGAAQSPISLPLVANGVAGDLVLDWRTLSNPVTVSNNGHTFQVSVSTNSAGAASTAVYQNKTYHFQQFHFHG